MGDVYKALADATRRTILDELLERDRQTLFELCGRLASRHGLTSSRQAVSQHLEVLEAAGLVIAAKEGRYKFHSISTAPLREITDRWPYRKKAGTPMSDPRAYGTLQSIDGRPALRFELGLDYPIERVWQAVSVPAELAQFFPGAADWTPATGETIDAGGMSVEVTQVDAPHRLAWVFAGQPQSFELTEEGDGCRLVFTHLIDDLPAAQTATGWETYLSRLEPHLAGRPLSEERAHRPWAEIHELYAERFGVDPEPGRLWAAKHLPDQAV
ncbi:ArsR/SmtB family transcription factor [Nesterenkonia muleiensis]|uniref:ArsR/SmtB family transcription factor n=1 Tax=Nesterenkonia muleiensis TaxID=2282648 RepID=UPI00192E3EB6|nr:SRPBCC domain-containing protein [Nesterenkonia muleiensis]